MQHVTNAAALKQWLLQRPAYCGALTNRAWHYIELKGKCLLSEHFLLVTLKSILHIAKI